MDSASTPRSRRPDQQGCISILPLPPKTPNEAATLVAQVIATKVANGHPKEATIERSVKARGAQRFTSITCKISRGRRLPVPIAFEQNPERRSRLHSSGTS